MSEARGDWEFYTSFFGFPSWSSVTNMCWMCGATGGDDAMRYTSAAPDAPWRASRKSHEAYVAEVAAIGNMLPMLLRVVRGFRTDCVKIDVLHCVDLGVASHILGNIFWECILAHAWGYTTFALNTQALMKDIKEFYRRTRTKSKLDGDLTPERLRTAGGWPKLRAKAAATRHLAPFALELAHRFLGVRRVAIAQLLVRFYELIGEEQMFLTSEAKAELPKLGQRLCGLYFQLSRMAFESGARLWKPVPKVHLFDHLCTWQAVEVGNPRFYWAYADEDMVGHVIEVARSCHPRTLSVTALFKWVLFAFPSEE